jgi:hypothetical protein
MTARPKLALAILALVVACASRPPPPPAIETQEAEIGPSSTPPTPPRAKSEPKLGKVDPDLPQHAGTSGTASSPEVELLEAGQAPRRELRHEFKKGTAQKLSIKAKTRVKGASVPLPTLSMSAPMDARIVEVNKAGEARFELSAGPFQTGGGGGGELGVLGGLLSGGGSDKFAGWGWITARGIVKEFHVEEGAKDGDAPVESGDPFPVEAVGVGARWQVKSVLEEKGVPVQQTSTYELVKLDKKAVHTKVSRVQVPLGGGEGDAATSEGELVFRFADVYPTGKLELSRALALDIPGLDGAKLQMTSEVTIGKR